MEDWKREIYEQDAIEALQEEAYDKRQLEQGKEKCSECGEWVYEEELYEGICDDCIGGIIIDTDYQTALEYAQNNGDEFEFLTDYIFTQEEVMEILKKEIANGLILDKSMFNSGIREYLMNDESHYIDYLKKKGDL